MSALESIIIETSLPIQHSVIWLHGLGADGHDFAPIVPELNIANTRFIFPHAPHQPITMNNGYQMRAWYDLFGLGMQHQQDEAGMREMQKNIEGLIAHEVAQGIPENNIVLAGFSQGGAMALFTALRHPKRLAGVLALSTYMPLKEKLAQEASTANQAVPILMAHGSFDSVITLDTCLLSRQLLQSLDYPLEWHEYAMAHSVCAEEINDISRFLHKVFQAE
ncbi:MAG: alpha/beta hydrolase [Candidatus Methylopumilus sp.]